MPSTTPSIPSEVMQCYLPEILLAMPDAWRGTTFKNSALLGRTGFSTKLANLILHKAKDGSKINTSDLVEVGNAEDYLR
jgi:hypothetical protein